MAEEVIENELTNCTICFDTYSNPKILQCFHVYCQKCLVKLVTRDQLGQLSLSCPICRQVTPVPARGTAGLQSAFHINRLLEILDQHKKPKGEAAGAERVDHRAKNFPSALCCSEHDGREVELFCETCGELICYKCVAKGSKHHSHDYKDINESFERYKEEVAPSLEPLEKKMIAMTKVLTQLDRQCDEIAHQHATIEAEIRESSKRLHDIISNRQDQLISQLDHITKKKLKHLVAQRDRIETLQAQLSSCLEFTRASLKTGIEQREVLVMKTNILKQVQELATPSQPDIFTLSIEADVVFSGSADAAAVCESYGRVYTLNSPDPSKCVATGRGTEEAVVGEKATSLNTISFKGKPCSEASVSMSFQVELVSLPVKKFGSPILSLSVLGKPYGVAVNRKEEVVVAECGAHCVSVFSSCGEKLRSFGTHGSGEGQFEGPSDVAVDGEGNLLVLDRGNYRIQKFTADGHFLQTVGSEGLGLLQFNYPTGITYSASNNKVYVADTWNHRIQILTSDLRFISMFGIEGSGKGQFRCPRGVATDSTGRVYVADSLNDRIQVFTAEGTLLRMFGRERAGRGELYAPWGVGVDANGFVYVSENLNFCVTVFTSEGTFVTAFGTKGKKIGQMLSPTGLAVDNSGVVYVCDSHNNCVQKF